MDLNKLPIWYNCIYCKKRLTSDKNKIVQHLKNGCKKMKNICNHSLLVEATTYSCNVYLNEKNCHVDVKKNVLPLVTWPTTVKFFTTRNNWKTVHLMDSDWSSSDDDSEEEEVS